ncbi:MAG: nitroreductase [Desulfopila sp.]
MNVAQAIRNRKSTRAFLPQMVEREKIVRLLDTARHSPSGANTQPWQVAVVSGRQKQALQQQMIEAFERGERDCQDYRYYPEKWLPPFNGRRTSCGKQLYDSLQIERQDRKRRLEQWAANYRAFDAPVMLLFFIDSSLATGSYIDYGMFLQSLMLSAVEEGLATCPQAALAEYPDLIRTFLGYPDTVFVVCGLALGYEDPTAPVNQYRTPREEVATFTRFFE